MMESLVEFKKRIRKANQPREYKIRNSLGVYDGYKYYRKTKPKDKKYIMSESQYFAIIRGINLLLADEICNGNEVTLPFHMGTIELRKFNSYLKIDNNGKLHSHFPIDWNKTLELWYEDEESYKKRTLVKMEEKEVFKIYYNRETANFENKSFYEFAFIKDLKLKLKQKIREGVIDAPLLKRKEKLNG